MWGKITHRAMHTLALALAASFIAVGLVAVDSSRAHANQWLCQWVPLLCTSGNIPGVRDGVPTNRTPAPKPPPPAPPRTSNPAFTWSGTAYFDSPYGYDYSTFLGKPVARSDPRGLPGARGAFTAHDGNGGTISVRGNGDNHYRGQCRTEYRWIWNPIDEKVELYYAYGVSWVDRMFWNSDGNSWREVSYTCLYPGAPQPVIMTCAYWGSGKLQGPLANSTGYPVIDSNGEALITTLPRQWIAPRTATTLGSRWESSGKNRLLGLSPAGFAQYVKSNCSDFNYLGWFQKDQCTTLYGGKRLSGDDCAVVPGNYLNKFKGQQLRCAWTYYPYWNFYRASGCTEKAVFNQDRPVAMYCKGRSPSGRGLYYNGYDYRYNFATCGDSFPMPQCNYEGNIPAPAIITPDGTRGSLSTQALANGQQWILDYPTLSVQGAENKRQRWILVQGSEPTRGGDPSGEHQPYMVHFDPGATGRGVLVFEDSKRSYPGWDRERLYLRLYQASGIADRNLVFGNGEVRNPIRISKDSLMPLGIYAKYDFTVKRFIETEVAGRIEIDVPMYCTTSMASFYSVSGRATG